MRKMKRLLVLGGITLASMMAAAQNPIICDRYTPDPAPYVHNDTLYLFVDHGFSRLNGFFLTTNCTN
jgi:hypothetical protein